MSLRNLYKGLKIIETIQNYSLSGIFNIEENTRKSSSRYYYQEESFWKSVMQNPEKFWGKEIDLYNFVVSEWVARVPGLYWTEQSQNIRTNVDSHITFKSREYTEFNPPGKSKKVLGGIGTLLLPTTEQGTVLMSVSSSSNASTGVPILVFSEVLSQLKIKQGNTVNIKKARWQPMDIQWVQHFGSMKDIPRGYLVIDDPNKIEVFQSDLPVIYHPFSIMEYENADTKLYDFVYVRADSKAEDIDLKIEKFFEYYRKKDDRNGEYLLNPNVKKPIFEARYMTPLDLQKPSEKAKLKLLYERVKGQHFNNVAIDLLVNDLPKFYQSSRSIITLAENVGINPAILNEDSATTMSAQLISLCIEKEKVELLVDRMLFDYPQIFK